MLPALPVPMCKVTSNGLLSGDLVGTAVSLGSGEPRAHLMLSAFGLQPPVLSA